MQTDMDRFVVDRVPSPDCLDVMFAPSIVELIARKSLWWDLRQLTQENLFLLAGSLIRLDLSHNQLKRISAEMFYGLERLQVLDISGNPVVHIEPMTFIHLPAVKLLTAPATQSAVSFVNWTFTW